MAWRILAYGGLIIATCSYAAAQSTSLRDAREFADITDKKERSRALFNEAARVLTHPRCINCHPADDHPTQGDDKHIHMPPVSRGPAGLGFGPNTCQTCHTEQNYTLRERASYMSIPGHPRWALAPIEMAWQGKSLSDICQQIKDPSVEGDSTGSRAIRWPDCFY